MAETLGSLCDKLVTVKLKMWHSEDPERLKSLKVQEQQLHKELGEFITGAITGQIPPERLTFAANKVYKKEGNEPEVFEGSLGELFSKLADVNCRLWHVQEKVYEFESVPLAQKDGVIKQLAILNLERNNCIDNLDRELQKTIQQA
jgi:hypothetical protein